MAKRAVVPAGKTPPNVPVIAAGAVALVLGVGFLMWGLAPAKGFGPAMDAFTGTPPDDLGDQIKDTMSSLGARVWADVLGFVFILGGIITVSMGRPVEKSVEQLVQDALDARLSEPSATTHAPPLPAAPSPVAALPVGLSTAAPRPPQVGRRCPDCGSLMIAGGRICPHCGPVAKA